MRKFFNCAKKIIFFKIITYFFKKVKFARQLLLKKRAHMCRFTTRARISEYGAYFCPHIKRIWGCDGSFLPITNALTREKVTKWLQIVTKWLQIDKFLTIFQKFPEK